MELSQTEEIWKSVSLGFMIENIEVGKSKKRMINTNTEASNPGASSLKAEKLQLVRCDSRLALITTTPSSTRLVKPQI